MLKTIIPILLCAVMLCGCGKKDNTIVKQPTTPTNPTNPVVKEDSTYLISGLLDLTFDKTVQSKEELVAISPLTAKQKRITLSLEGLPAGVTATFTPPAGTMPYTSELMIDNNFGKPGTYDIKLKGTAEDGLTKSISFKITLPKFTCYQQLSVVKTFTTYDDKGQEIGQGMFEWYTDEFTINNVFLENFGSGQGRYHSDIWDVAGTIDCDKGTMTIPDVPSGDGVRSSTGASIPNYAITANGTYSLTEKTIVINITAVSDMGKTIKRTLKANF